MAPAYLVAMGVALFFLIVSVLLNDDFFRVSVALGCAMVIVLMGFVGYNQSGHALLQSDLDSGKVYTVDLMARSGDDQYVALRNVKAGSPIERHTFYRLDAPLPDGTKCFHLMATLGGETKALPIECLK